MKNRCKIFYVGDKSGTDGRGVLTIATEINEDGKTFRVGFAFCSSKDRFSRKIGRQKALARLNKNKMNTLAGEVMNGWMFEDRTIDTAIRVFDVIVKPSEWKNRRLVNIPEAGLTFVEKFGK